MPRVKSVEDYIASSTDWQDELRQLRAILMTTELREEIKWGAPCYTCAGKNVVSIGAFKRYFGLWFYQGVLLEDRKQVLINAQAGKTRALRQWRMTSARDIKPRILSAYIKEAIQLAKDGKAVAVRRNRSLAVPSLLEDALGADKALSAAFTGLRPGQRREYAEYVAEAKREATQRRRIAKILPMIAAGAGLNDRYRRV